MSTGETYVWLETAGRVAWDLRPLRDVRLLALKGGTLDFPRGLQELRLMYATGNVLELLRAALAPPCALVRLEVRIPAAIRAEIDHLPPLPPALKTLDVIADIRELPELPAGLQKLRINSDVLTGLPTLPASLRSLSTEGCRRLQNISGLPPGLRSLIASSHARVRDRELPPGLEVLRCRFIEWPLPNTLRWLQAPAHQLPAELPPLLESLQLCGDTDLPLPPLPPYLTRLLTFSSQHRPLEAEVNSGRRAAARRHQDRTWAPLVVRRRLCSAEQDLLWRPLWGHRQPRAAVPVAQTHL